MQKEWEVIIYCNSNGESEIFDFIKSKSSDNKGEIYSILKLLEQVGIDLHRPYSDYLRDGIHELRIKLSGEQTRTLYFFLF
jgi:hypothetical protein